MPRQRKNVLVLLTVLNTYGLYLQTELSLLLVTKQDPKSGDLIGIEFLLWKYSAASGRNKLIYRSFDFDQLIGRCLERLPERKSPEVSLGIQVHVVSSTISFNP